jgi:preprotein translocase subunit SecA
MLKWVNKLMGGQPWERELKRVAPIVEDINEIEPEMEELSDAELRDKTTEFRGRLLAGEDLDSLLPEAFAAVREASRRTIGLRHYDVQLIGGAILHRGQIAEMRTGEGKTLVATLPVYLNALAGKGVHVVTVNDYLAKRDAQWMGAVYHALGMSVGVIQHELAFLYDPEYEAEDASVSSLRPAQHRREAYQADITYGTNNEFGFDYLRDNMVWRLEDMVQRELHYAIVDEVDNILVDEARTPLIISGPAEDATKYYDHFARLVPRLRVEDDFTIDQRTRAITLTEVGIEKVERLLGVQNLYDPENYQLTHYLDNALRAEFVYKRDDQYVVKDGEIIIVDEFTGRLMPGRRYSEGLHQAIEAKEGVRVQRENVTLARITFQNYFRLYSKLAGMTGTALTEADEFRRIYNLDVVPIPTHRPMVRADQSDLVFKTEDAKFGAVVDEIVDLHERGQPVLVGTVSIEKSERLSAMLQRKGIPHQVLNAKQHEREAAVIAQAGRPGTVTIATNMAGRGVDILLGGNPAGLVDEILRRRKLDRTTAGPEDVEAAVREAEATVAADRPKVVELGGLHIVGTERHEARRIDNQLRGRSGRQGDPGSSRFYVSLQDDLMQRFGGSSIAGLMDKLGLEEDVPLEHSWVNKAIENAQTKVEAYNFDIRKHVVEYDDVMNKQREVIYADRRKVLAEENLRPMIEDWIREEIESLIASHVAGENIDEWDFDGLETALRQMIPLPDSLTAEALKEHPVDELVEMLAELASEAYDERERRFGPEAMRLLERTWLLRVIDELWIQHLTAIDDVREGIGLRAYGQRDPLIEYKVEAADMFDNLLAAIHHDVVYPILRVEIRQEPTRRPPQQMMTNREDGAARQPVRAGRKVGRNEPCPCGSGQKYKKCHGR